MTMVLMDSSHPTNICKNYPTETSPITHKPDPNSREGQHRYQGNCRVKEKINDPTALDYSITYFTYSFYILIGACAAFETPRPASPDKLDKMF